MLAEQQRRPAAAGAEARELFAQLRLQQQLFLDPDRHRGNERAQPARGGREVGLEQALELEERLVVEHDRIEAGEVGGAGREAVADRRRREARVVAPAREALLLRRRDQPPVDDQGRRGIVIVCGNTENSRHPARV